MYFCFYSYICEMKFVLLKMDRILRPEGYVIIPDAPNYVSDARMLGETMQWKCTKYSTEKQEDDKEQLLLGLVHSSGAHNFESVERCREENRP